MQHGCMERLNRKRGPAVWQFRWSEIDSGGKRLSHKKIVGTVEHCPDEPAARRAVVGLLSEINTDGRPTNPRVMTIAQFCDHFGQRELSKENTWRSHATKQIYKAYLTRWVRPHWHKYELAEIRTIQVESWLRRLPLAKSSCAKIRNLMSVLFNHACRYELFDRNPIYLVRQSAKCRRRSTVLMPAEIKGLVDNLGIRERTLVFLPVSTGLRQSELFGLKWGDIDFAEGHMHVSRSIVYGVVGPCKTEASQKPVPIHPILSEALLQWRKGVRYTRAEDWVFASKRYQGRIPYWGQAILRKYIRPVAQSVGIQKRFGWHTFRHYLDFQTMPSRRRIAPRPTLIFPRPTRGLVF
jgi:integrase